jgi:hypothetical protein
MSRAQDYLTGPAYNVNAHIERVRKLWDAYPLKEKGAADHLIRLIGRVMKRLPRAPAEYILQTAYGACVILFESERIYDPSFYPKTDYHSPPMFWRDELIALERAMSEGYRQKAERAIENMLVAYFQAAPEGAFIEEEDTATRVPFYELTTLPWWITLIAGTLLQYDGDLPLFPNARTRTLQNLFEASGKPYDPEATDVKFTYPKESKLQGSDLVHAYLHDTPFHALLCTNVPFTIPEATRFSGTWIVAPPNRGKTNLLLHQFEEDVKKNASIILMDSKGDLINPIRELESIRDRLVILEPSQEFPLALNPLDLGASTTHTVEFIEYVFRSLLDSTPTPLQGTLFRAVLLALKPKPDANFSDFRKILVDGWKPYEPYIRKLDEEDQDFFFKGEYDSKTYSETKAQLLWRIRDLTTRIPILRASFRAPRTLIDIGTLMDAGKIIILDVRKQLLGDSGCEFLGRLYIAMVRAAADQRSRRAEKDKLPCYFYIDEAHTIIREDEKLAGILQECRSQKIAMVLAHQAISQISSATTLAALSDCAIRMANSDEETAQLAPRLRTTPEALRSLPIGSFATFVRDTTITGAVTLRIPLAGVLKAPRMTKEAQDALTARMRANYAYAPALLGIPVETPITQPDAPQMPVPAEPPVVVNTESPVHAPADFAWPKK